MAATISFWIAARRLQQAVVGGCNQRTLRNRPVFNTNFEIGVYLKLSKTSWEHIFIFLYNWRD